MKHTHVHRPLLATAIGVTLAAFGAIPLATASDAKRPPAVGASSAGAVIPGGAIISARSVMLAPIAGGVGVAAPIANDGTFRLAGLAPGRYRLAVTSTAIAKQTQGATFGEKVNAGLASAGSSVAQGASLAKHDTAKNSVGNVRSIEVAPTTTEAPASSAQAPHSINNSSGNMPNRISMNVTVARQTQSMEVDGAPIDVEIGSDGGLSGRVAQP